MIILDTNVLSELMRPSPAEKVVRWVNAQAAATLYITAIAQAEIFHGILQLPSGRRRNVLAEAAESMFEVEFGSRILPFDTAAARLYGEIASERQRAGRPISQFDAQIAAIARASRASLATRNVTDFEGCGLNVVNPWGTAH